MCELANYALRLAQRQASKATHQVVAFATWKGVAKAEYVYNRVRNPGITGRLQAITTLAKRSPVPAKQPSTAANFRRTGGVRGRP